MQPESLTTLEDSVRRSHLGELGFGELVPRLIALGVESYHVDYRRGETVYRWRSDETHALRSPSADGPVADAFDVAAVRAAISGAQRGEVAYPEFVRRTVAAGCVGYDAWLAGRNVVYHGRRGEQWVERFPGAAPPPRPAVRVDRPRRPRRPRRVLHRQHHDARGDRPAATPVIAAPVSPRGPRSRSA
jgi:uncharacterized protein YbcV (DUF1398 family)